MELARLISVQPARDGWRYWREQLRRFGPKGEAGAADGWQARAIYAGISLIVIAASTVDAFSIDYDLTRLGRPHGLWEPFLWEASSGLVIIALLGFPRRASKLTAILLRRPATACLAFAGLAIAFSALHLMGMVLLRDLAYAAIGKAYVFNWSVNEVLYEFRKDLFSFSTIAILFGLAERAFGRRAPIVAAVAADRSTAKDAAAPDAASRRSDIWLRDGRTSILVDARDIIWVGSAGNYVEYAMAAGPRHLIRSTLQQEETRLSAFGIARVHRTRLINLKRIVAITWRKSGDFELSLDTGETIAGSRRHKESIAAIGGEDSEYFDDAQSSPSLRRRRRSAHASS